MATRSITTGLLAACVALTTGCASYRVSSNVEPAAPSAFANQTAAKVVLSEGSIPDRQYKVVGPVEVSVKKLTLFHKDPTKELANDALIERARAMNADAVINIIYTTGIGLTTWGYIDAKGLAVKLLP